MYKNRFNLLTIIIWSLISVNCLFAAESVTTEILLMENRFYPRDIMRLIRQSKKSIYVCMTEVEYSGNEKHITSRLLKELIYQAKRGIKVEVILEGGSLEEPKNIPAKNFLFENGVEIFFDTKDKLTKCNMLIVDEFTSVIGSTVWTEKSLFKNDETEFWVESEEFAKVLIERFNDIKIFGEKIR